MNRIAQWYVARKIGSILGAQRFTGYRTQICLAAYLVAFAVQFLGLQLNWDPELGDMMEWIKELAVGLGGLALAAKVTRSGPEGQLTKNGGV